MTRMSTWNDKDAPNITHWIANLSDGDTQYATIIASDKLRTNVTPTIPSLEDSASSSEFEEFPTGSLKRTRHTQQEQIQGEPPQEKLRRHTVGHAHIAQPGSGSLEEQYFESEESELGAPKMTQDTASVSGSSVSALSTRPILEAKPPSRRVLGLQAQCGRC